MQKHVNLVDLVKSFPTNIFLQKLASIQKRTSPIKFAHLAEKSQKGSISNLSTKVPSPPVPSAPPELPARARLRGSESELGAAVPQEDAKTRVSRDRDSKRRSAIDQLYWELALLEQEEKTAQTRRRPFRPS